MPPRLLSRFGLIGDPCNVQVIAWQRPGNLHAADDVTAPAQVP
jgi:hypothetical protein